MLAACRGGDAAPPRASPTPEEIATPEPATPPGPRIRGRITIDGPAPPRVTRNVRADPALCGSNPIVDREMLVDPATKGVRYAVVTLTNDTAGTASPATPVTRELEQAKCDYFPYVTVVPRGSKIRVRNADEGLHDVHVIPESDRPATNHALRPDGEVTLELPETGRVRLACDLHYWARAWVIVDDAPYSAVTDAEGRYELAGVPPGSWRLTVWHERLGTAVHDLLVTDRDLEENVALPPPAPSRPRPK